ncbi:sulfatase [Granulosicoccus antarcticus]|uniref:Arylsulfatase n=1 Tax=Granulosicoccus antarcticus IMCC3135 TaxID=1192854 RepID=A0A2Z2NW19_9GAMM|nr:sulfatase-like hydrolase/transferase [Granulosicoccus antarcticus]ASJ75652.1 Arylsulfatase [Granulosicoccus antarcticus IMCC3135]
MSDKTNILLISTDQQHFNALGAVNSDIKTPNLDRLCREGTRFNRAYCPSPVCTPSRASMITGLYPSHHGAWTIGVKLDENVDTIGSKLSAAGYQTGLIGKAHFQPLASRPGSESLEAQPTLRDLDFWRNFHGPWYGFDHIELSRNHADESHVGQHYAIWLEEQGLMNWRDYFQPLPGESAKHAPDTGTGLPYWAREQRHWELPENLHYTRWTAERSLAFIDKHAAAEKPFFLWSSFHDPHPPYVVPEPWASMYKPEDMNPGQLVPGEHDRNGPHFAKTQETNPDFGQWHTPFEAHGCGSHLYSMDALRKDMAIYYGMMSFVDQQVGRILDRLDELGIADNTLLVFTTDHGHFLGQHGLVAKGPFHYEDMLRIPMIVRWPGKVPEGKVSEAIQSLVDLTPSFMDAAELGAPDDLQGISQIPVWTGEKSEVRDFALCENRHNPHMPHLVTYIGKRYKITVYKEGEFGELFDLETDPDELQNLWDLPSAANIKKALLQDFVQGLLKSEPMSMPRIAHA